MRTPPFHDVFGSKHPAANKENPRYRAAETLAHLPEGFDGCDEDAPPPAPVSDRFTSRLKFDAPQPALAFVDCSLLSGFYFRSCAFLRKSCRAFIFFFLAFEMSTNAYPVTGHWPCICSSLGRCQRRPSCPQTCQPCLWVYRLLRINSAEAVYGPGV
jgi:hypothetical protein